MGTLKNRLIETVLLSTQTNVKTDGLEIFCLSGHMKFRDKSFTIQVSTENCQAYRIHKIYILTPMLKYSKGLEV